MLVSGSDTEYIPMNSKYELGSIYSVEEFTGNVFTRFMNMILMWKMIIKHLKG